MRERSQSRATGLVVMARATASVAAVADMAFMIHGRMHRGSMIRRALYLADFHRRRCTGHRHNDEQQNYALRHFAPVYGAMFGARLNVTGQSV
jgi:hypothetical protein